MRDKKPEDIVEKLPKRASVYSLGKQLIDATTSSCANALEARSARSSNEFISSFSISLKEAKETSLWLSFLKDLNLIDGQIYDKLFKEYQGVGKILRDNFYLHSFYFLISYNPV